MNLYSKFLSILFTTILLVTNSFGQTKIITGKVTNEFGEPVANATINFVGSREYGTMSLKDGTYRTNIPKNSDSIKCRHLSYYYRTVKIDGNNLINFILTKQPAYSTEISIIGTHKYTQEEITKSQQVDKYIEDDKIFSTIEVYAEFPGGTNALRKYFETAIVYPDSATVSDVKGIVKVEFVIGIDGYPKSIFILKGINKFTDEAVVNAIKKMPKWRQAIQNGSYTEQSKAVSVSFDIKGSIQ